MLNIARAVFGGVMLFLGLDLDWLFSIGIGLLVGMRLVPLLPADAPLWLPPLLVAAIGVIGFLPHVIYPESSFFVTGFFFGGFVLSEYASDVLNAFIGTGLIGSDWLIFFVGGITGAIILAATKEWGIMFATALLGAFLIVDLFPYLTSMASSLIAGGLFIIGAIVQTIIMQVEKSSQK